MINCAMDKMTVKKPEFFFEKKAFGHMARYKDIKTPMLKKTKNTLIEVANYLAFAAIIGYCVFTIETNVNIWKTTYTTMHSLFHVEP